MPDLEVLAFNIYEIEKTYGDFYLGAGSHVKVGHDLKRKKKPKLGELVKARYSSTDVPNFIFASEYNI